MGCFSWLKAQMSENDNVVNVPDGEAFKFLIPKEFGGGHIIDKYRGYGELDGKYDMYELLAFWNNERCTIMFEGTKFPVMKTMDKYTDKNRCQGIEIGCCDHEIDKLKYPLKLVSVDLDITYEECEGRSYGDPEQGFYAVYRDGTTECDEDEDEDDWWEE